MIFKIKSLYKSTLVRETFIYGVTNAIYSGLPLFLMPFLVVIMSPEDYGMVDLFRTLSMVLIPVMGLSTVQSISRFFYDLENQDFKTFVSSILIFHFFTAIVGTIILYLVGLLFENKYQLITGFSIVFFLFNQIIEALLAIYRVNKQVKKYMLIRLATIVLDLALLFYLYQSFNSFDWIYRVLPNVIATFFVGIGAIIIFINNGYKIIFNKNQLYIAIGYSAPLIVHMLSGYVLNLGDRFFILSYLDENELGRYAVAYQFGMAVNFLYTSFNLAWTPTFFEWMKLKKYNQIKKVERLLYIGIPLFGCVVLLLFFGFNRWSNALDQYDIPVPIVILILISYILFSLYKFRANYFFYSKNTKVLSSLTLISAVLSIVLNFVLIPLWGIFGAALSTFITMLFLYISVYRRSISETNNY